jgi:hypothetical protein
MKIGTDQSRETAEEIVGKYFDTLDEELVKINIDPQRVWNMDEGGFYIEHTPVSFLCHLCHCQKRCKGCTRQSVL